MNIYILVMLTFLNLSSSLNSQWPVMAQVQSPWAHAKSKQPKCLPDALALRSSQGHKVASDPDSRAPLLPYNSCHLIHKAAAALFRRAFLHVLHPHSHI